MKLKQNKIMTAVIAASISFLFSCGGGDQRTPSPQVVAEQDIPALMTHFNVPGVSIAVIKDFQVKELLTYGVKDTNSLDPVVTETLFQAASISKSLSAVAIMQLAQDGFLDLDEDINVLLNSWQLPENSYTEQQKVTMRRLLSHTAGTNVHGFAGYRTDQSLPTVVEVLSGGSLANTEAVKVVNTPGDKFTYSGGGYTIAQQASSDVSQTSFALMMEQNILQPLAMSNSSFALTLPAHLVGNESSAHNSSGNVVDGRYHIYPESAAAGLWTTAEDLAKFMIEMQLSLGAQSNLLLNQENTHLMLEPVIDQSYGLGFELYADDQGRYFGHGGVNEGFNAFMFAHKTDGIGLIIMTNSDRGSKLYPDILNLIGKQEGWPGFQ